MVLTVQGDCNFRGHGCSLVRTTAGHGAVAGSAGAVAGPDQRDGSQIRPGLPTAAIRSSAIRSAATAGEMPRSAASRSTAPVGSKIRAVLLRARSKLEAVQLVADLDHPAGVHEVVGGVGDAPLHQRVAVPCSPSSASWLLAAPQTMAALSDSTVDASRAPPRAHGA